MAEALRFAERSRRFGIAAAIQHAAWRRLYRLLGYTPYLGLELSADHATPHVPAAPGAHCRPLEAAELFRLADDPRYELEPTFIAKSMQRGDWCMGTFVGGSLAAYSFQSASPTEFHPRLRYCFAEGWVYHFKAFTLPAWRGRHLHALNLLAVLEKLRAVAGFKGLVTLVLAVNHASLRSFERLGFQRTRRFVVLRRESPDPWVLGNWSRRYRVEKLKEEDST